MELNLNDLEIFKSGNNDKFDLAEQLGRLNFIGWCTATKPCQYVSSNLDKYGEYDVEVLWRGKPALVEIKYREGYQSNSFDSWMLESDKLNRLQKNKGYKLLYYNLFADLECALWDITNINDNNKIIKQLQKTNFDKETKKKGVIFLNINNSIKSF